MLKGDFIFVYGTLRLGERMDLRNQKLNFAVDFISKDKISAKMYHIGTYPGVKEVTSRFNPNAPTVVGEVFKIRSPSVVAVLDAYEGYDSDYPERGLYNRCQAYTQRGRLVWVYTYNPIVRAEQLIEGGDWCRSRATSVSGQKMFE